MTKTIQPSIVINHHKYINLDRLSKVKIHLDKAEIHSNGNRIMVRFPFEGSVELFCNVLGEGKNDWVQYDYNRIGNSEIPIYQPDRGDTEIEVEFAQNVYYDSKIIIEEATRLLDTTIALVERNNLWLKN